MHAQLLVAQYWYLEAFSPSFDVHVLSRRVFAVSVLRMSS
jgi:hypothetical protein